MPSPRIDVHIASHFREERVAILATQLEAISLWENVAVSVAIYSNNDNYLSRPAIAALKTHFEEKGWRLELVEIKDLTDPWLLTWAHKSAVPAWLKSSGTAEDAFLYLEDDIVVSKENIRYLLFHLKLLSPIGLIPGLVRYEKTPSDLRLVDIYYPENWRWQRNISLDGNVYHANCNPYWAGFILNRELAQEYIHSPSFGIESSATLTHWGLAERSAMGLTFEQPSRRLRSRTVVPLVDGRPHPASLVWHCPNNYTAKAHPIVARLTIDQAYPRFSALSYLANKLHRALKRVRQ